MHPIVRNKSRGCLVNKRPRIDYSFVAYPTVLLNSEFKEYMVSKNKTFNIYDSQILLHILSKRDFKTGACKCWFSERTLSNETGISRRRCSLSLNNLASMKILRDEGHTPGKNKGQYHFDNQQFNTLITLTENLLSETL
jgi:hypothetical protein